MKIVILVRLCPNYANFTETSFKEQVNLPYAPAESILDFCENNILKIWNDYAFYTNFFKYRQKIADLAKQNVLETNCEIIWGFNNFESWYANNQEDCFILPCNDDDWFDPKVFNLTERDISSGTSILIWKKTILHSITTMKFGICDGYSFKGNTWGIRLSYLKKLDYKKVKDILFQSHKKTESVIRYNIPKKNWLTIEETLSVCVRHVGALDFLNQLSTDTLIEIELPKICNRPIVPPDIPPSLMWSEKFVNELYKINLQLRSLKLNLENN
jgi:hypothetical protein